mgnify:CR=1 FL=1
MDKKKTKHTEISVLYNLPENWADETAFSFDHLSKLVLQLHDSAYSATVKAINRFATIRNYVIGFYIVEYEQHGNDRAKYGDRLLKRLAESVNKRGINETILKNCRRFYLAYPQINEISPSVNLYIIRDADLFTARTIFSTSKVSLVPSFFTTYFIYPTPMQDCSCVLDSTLDSSEKKKHRI